MNDGPIGLTVRRTGGGFCLTRSIAIRRRSRLCSKASTELWFWFCCDCARLKCFSRAVIMRGSRERGLFDECLLCDDLFRANKSNSVSCCTGLRGIRYRESNTASPDTRLGGWGNKSALFACVSFGERLSR